jgi:hypothetical protein
MAFEALEPLAVYFDATHLDFDNVFKMVKVFFYLPTTSSGQKPWKKYITLKGNFPDFWLEGNNLLRLPGAPFWYYVEYRFWQNDMSLKRYTTNFFITTATTVVIPVPTATSKISIRFWADGTIGEVPLYASSASLELDYLDLSADEVRVLQQLRGSDILNINEPLRFTLNKGNDSAEAEVYTLGQESTLQATYSIQVQPNDLNLDAFNDGPISIDAQTPSFYLRPDLKLVSLQYDATQVDWGAGPNSGCDVVLVNVEVQTIPIQLEGDNGDLVQATIPTVSFADGQGMNVIRSRFIKRDQNFAYTWSAQYYNADGSIITIGSPPGQLVTDSALILPPSPTSTASGTWTPFVILAQGGLASS